MISKKALKDYDFGCIEDYYDYVVISRINGNPKQVKDLIKDMSVKQYNGFIAHVKNSSENIEHYLKIRKQRDK